MPQGISTRRAEHRNGPDCQSSERSRHFHRDELFRTSGAHPCSPPVPPRCLPLASSGPEVTLIAAKHFKGNRALRLHRSQTVQPDRSPPGPHAVSPDPTPLLFGEAGTSDVYWPRPLVVRRATALIDGPTPTPPTRPGHLRAFVFRLPAPTLTGRVLRR